MFHTSRVYPGMSWWYQSMTVRIKRCFPRIFPSHFVHRREDKEDFTNFKNSAMASNRSSSLKGDEIYTEAGPHSFITQIPFPPPNHRPVLSVIILKFMLIKLLLVGNG